MEEQSKLVPQWWRARVLRERQNKRANVYVREMIVFAADAESARQAIAKDLGRHYLDDKIALPEPLQPEHIYSYLEGPYIPSVAENFLGRSVRDVLVDVAIGAAF